MSNRKGTNRAGKQACKWVCATGAPRAGHACFPRARHACFPRAGHACPCQQGGVPPPVHLCSRVQSAWSSVPRSGCWAVGFGSPCGGAPPAVNPSFQAPGDPWVPPRSPCFRPRSLLRLRRQDPGRLCPPPRRLSSWTSVCCAVCTWTRVLASKTTRVEFALLPEVFADMSTVSV